MQVVLSNGDLAVDTGTNPGGDGDYYECVASFEQRNVTLARYRMTSPHGHSGLPFFSQNVFTQPILYIHTCFTWSVPFNMWGEM